MSDTVDDEPLLTRLRDLALVDLDALLLGSGGDRARARTERDGSSHA